MKEFQLLKDLIKSLSLKEVKHLNRKLLVGNQLDVEANGSSLLFETVANNHDVSVSEIYLKLYNKKNEVALRKLLQRLTNKVYDVFFINELMLGQVNYEDRTKRIFLFEKKMLLVDILRFRGLFKISDQMLEDIISESIKYECFEVSISALNKKRLRSSIIINERQNIFFEKQIKSIFKLLISINKCKNIYSNLISLHNKKSNRIILDEYKKGLNEISFLAKTNNCKTIEYYRLLVQTQQFSLQNEDQKAVNVALQLVELIDNNNTLYSKNRLGNAYINLALHCRNLGDYSRSLTYLEKANLLLNRIDQTLGITYYQFCLNYCLIGDLNKMNYYYKLSIKIDMDPNNQEFLLRFYFINAFIQFATQKFVAAKSIIESLRNNYKDDFNFEFEKKLLYIMVNIELEDYDICDKLIESFKKFTVSQIEYLDRNKDVDNLLQLLRHLMKVGYDFDQLNQSTLDLLIVTDSLTRFRDNSLIPFTPWFISKVKNVPYDHSKAMKELQRKIKKEKLQYA